MTRYYLNRKPVMKKQNDAINITESQLTGIVKESIKKYLNENNPFDLSNITITPQTRLRNMIGDAKNLAKDCVDKAQTRRDYRYYLEICKDLEDLYDKHFEDKPEDD